MLTDFYFIEAYIVFFVCFGLPYDMWTLRNYKRITEVK